VSNAGRKTRNERSLEKTEEEKVTGSSSSPLQVWASLKGGGLVRGKKKKRRSSSITNGGKRKKATARTREKSGGGTGPAGKKKHSRRGTAGGGGRRKFNGVKREGKGRGGQAKNPAKKQITKLG